MVERLDQTAIANELQGELRDLLCLAVVGDHVRWVLVGEERVELAQWLADSVGQWRLWADQVAIRLVGLGAAPDGRVRSLAKDVPFNPKTSDKGSVTVAEHSRAQSDEPFGSVRAAMSD
jgi:starvation-inducible DNA-binding protein